MEAAVQQSSVDKQCLEIANKELLFENDRLSQQIMSQDIVLTVMTCMSLNVDSMNMRIQISESSDKCFNLEAELSKSQNAYKDLLKNYSQLEKHCISLEATIQLNQEIFQKDKPCDNPDIPKYFEINNLKAQFKDKDTTICMFKLDLEPLVPRLLQKRDAHIDYLRNTQEHANILREIVEQAKGKQPLDTELDFACKHATRIQELLIYVRDTCPNTFKPSAKKVDVTPINNVKKVRFAEPLTSSSNIKQHSLSNSNSKIICATCNKSMFNGVHDMCLLDFVKNVKSRAKSAKKHKKQNIWKPTGHVFTEVGLEWKPTGRTSANVVPPKQTTSYSAVIQKPEIKVYSRKPKNVKNVGSSKMAKIVESKNANHLEPNHTWGSNATDIPSSSSLVKTVRFGNDQIARIMRYGEYQLGNVIISRVYYVEEGVDPLLGSRDTNLYTISLDDMLKSSPICLLSKASKTKSWLWHHRLSHLNFGTLNKLAKDGLARGIPRLKFQKDHLCSACALGKSKKSSHQPKAEDTNQEKLYLLHLDLCGPMRVASINRKRYILVIVDDYSRFTWVRFLKTKDEAHADIIKCIKNIQVHLNATVRNV
ncbi:retrovirus-related pol polyprotein from transposon TNT 1-94 [Tanacetum coccineum]